MTSREKILTAIRSCGLPARALPTLEQTWITYPDPVAQFAGVLEGIGGSFVRVGDVDELNRRLDELPVYRDARQAVSLVAGVGGRTSIGRESPTRTPWKRSILRFCRASLGWRRTDRSG